MLLSYPSYAFFCLKRFSVEGLYFILPYMDISTSHFSLQYGVHDKTADILNYSAFFS